MMRWEILQLLIDKNDYKTYCEIGVFHLWNWNQITCEEKVAVDPDRNIPIPQGGEFYNITSDEFFAKLDPEKKFSIFFIDGLHQADQVYRDIQNCLIHLEEGGTVVLHDCNPPLYEHTTTGINGNWTGDTYKAVLSFIDNYETEYTYNTVDTDWGVGIIQKGTWDWMSVMQPHSHGFRKDKNESDWDFFDRNREGLINLITVEEFKERYL